MNATAQMINSERRLHLQHGPIDLVVEAWGEKSVVRQAYQQAFERFQTVLTELVDELPVLRSSTNTARCDLTGVVARRMWLAASTVGTGAFITPMIAVAGSVADEVLQAMVVNLELQKACVNNGGDIALMLATGQSTSIGVVADLRHQVDNKNMPATLAINDTDGVGGVATSGWRGRSFSTGIADAVTVMAKDAATADAAATLIANAVDIPDCSAIIKKPASDVDPDSDLGDQLITTDVLPLSDENITVALAAGCQLADQLVSRKLIVSAGLSLGGKYQTTTDKALSHQSIQNQPRNYYYA